MDLKAYSLRERLEIAVSSCLFIGFIPFAPGTFGSLPGIFLAYVLNSVSWLYCLFFIAAFFFISVYCSSRAAFLLGADDPGQVVIDEALGMTVSLLWIKIDPLSVIVAFILFRVLDILKPYPIYRLETVLEGGIGIVADDLAAGIIANILTRLVYWGLHVW